MHTVTAPNTNIESATQQLLSTSTTHFQPKQLLLAQPLNGGAKLIYSLSKSVVWAPGAWVTSDNMHVCMIEGSALIVGRTPWYRRRDIGRYRLPVDLIACFSVTIKNLLHQNC